MATRLDLKRKIMNIRQFKRPHIGHDQLEIRAVMFGFRNESWYVDKPLDVMRDLEEAYPEQLP
ncbi:MAG: hypothetical protein D9C04_05150 [Nitrosopumilus sp. B06]|nr:MAG: hypothetical protein D9C04_05150 [Nitrosopumilus sp. B06]